MKLIFFFENVEDFFRLQKPNENLRKKIWRLNMLLDILSIMKRIHMIGKERVTKQY